MHSDYTHGLARHFHFEYKQEARMIPNLLLYSFYLLNFLKQSTFTVLINYLYITIHIQIYSILSLLILLFKTEKNSKILLIKR